MEKPAQLVNWLSSHIINLYAVQQKVVLKK